jgi:hypothetical protein
VSTFRCELTLLTISNATGSEAYPRAVTRIMYRHIRIFSHHPVPVGEFVQHYPTRNREVWDLVVENIAVEVFKSFSVGSEDEPTECDPVPRIPLRSRVAV